MPLPKGSKSNNPNGRPKGKPNRITSEVRSLIFDGIEDDLSNLKATLTRLQPAERLAIIARLLPFVAPKLREITDVKSDFEAMTDGEILKAAAHVLSANGFIVTGPHTPPQTETKHD